MDLEKLSNQFNIDTVNSAKALSLLSSQMARDNSDRINAALSVQKRLAKQDAREAQNAEVTFEILKALNQLNEQQIISEKAAAKRDIDNTKLNKRIFFISIAGLIITAIALIHQIVKS